MKLIDFVLAVVVIALGLFFVLLMFGILMPGEPAISGELFSDNWFHNPHPGLALICFVALVFILTPFKQIFSSKKEEKQQA
jgi:hypothetical protein